MKLAIQLPGFGNIPQPSPVGEKFTDLGSLLSAILNIAFYLVVFMAFYWLVWGAWQYIMAGGNKEGLAKARARIRWALIGLLVTLIAYFVAKYAGEIFTPGRGGVPF
ncbi:hypothetical protein HYZ06_00945 [Candidatus Daviesbacteria bacterium]|nr:hypothetical protein [Candidatus Daviesbacteria bacterium]